MEIVELKTFTEEFVAGLGGLLRELSATAEATEERVRMVIESPNMHQYAAFDEDDNMSFQFVTTKVKRGQDVKNNDSGFANVETVLEF